MSLRYLILLLTLILSACQPKKEGKLPNIVFILIDDLGWNDLTCYGSTFYETPAIDQLARSGVRFTDAYAAASICSPTRASILTGKSPARLNMTDWIPGSNPKNRPLLGAEDQHALPLSEITFAERLKEEGYRTGFFGKWHLGGVGYLPEDQGFDTNIGGHDAGQPATYFHPYQKGNKFDVPGLPGGEAGEYLTDRLTTESLQFIHENTDQPFLLYLSHYAVHTPIEAKDSLVQKYRRKATVQASAKDSAYHLERDHWTRQDQNNPVYAAMVESVDQSVARIRAELEMLGLAEETIIVFTSDNGGLTTLRNKRAPTAVRPLRAGKGWLYEGGIRVPLMISWPGKIEARTSADLTTSIDLYPTLLDLLGLDQMPEQDLDGKSLSPQLTGRDKASNRRLYWHFPHYHGSGSLPSAAIRMGDYKLIQFYEQDSVELYDLSNDLSETKNLVDSLPGKAKTLLRELQAWQAETGAQLPKTNPAYNSSK